MNPSRRQALAGAAALVGAAVASAASGDAAAGQSSKRPPDEPFGYCLTTSTLRGHKLGLEKEIELVAKAGYQAIEPWLNEIEEYVK